MLQLDKTSLEDKIREVQSLHHKLFETIKVVFYDTNPNPVKYMMKKHGILKANKHRLPMMRASKELEESLNGVLQQMESLT